jgi:hypothetical protein
MDSETNAVWRNATTSGRSLYVASAAYDTACRGVGVLLEGPMANETAVKPPVRLIHTK